MNLKFEVHIFFEAKVTAKFKTKNVSRNQITESFAMIRVSMTGLELTTITE